ncbi:MAG TPA: mandelate racemase/muconate lactonizing enzyme family protein, partial [Ktedonobacteraceae bacterium]
MNTMHIIDIQCRAYRLPFLHSFSTAHSLSTVREGIIVQVTTEQGITGIGEIAPLVETTPMATSTVGATFMVARPVGLTHALALLPTLATQLHHKTLHEALDLVRTLVGSPSQENNTQTTTASTLCGLEIALLDAIGKTEGHTLSTLLSPSGFIPRTVIPVNAVIGAKDTQATIAAALTAKNNGFHCIKLKVGASHSAAHSAQMHCAHAEIERIA